MKQINNYILEKLHIGKNLKKETNDVIANVDNMLKIAQDYLLKIFRINPNMTSYTTCVKDDDKTLGTIYVEIKGLDHNSIERISKYIQEEFTDNGIETYKSVSAKDIIEYSLEIF